MQVKMEDRLACRRRKVETDVKAIRLVLSFDLGFCPVDVLPDCLFLVSGKIVPCGRMPSRDDKQMPRDTGKASQSTTT